MASESQTSPPPPVFVNVGCGPRGSAEIPLFFRNWRELRVDVDPAVKPDLIGNLTDLSALTDNSVDALWAAHCLEHLYLHDAPRALVEFCRVLKPKGFACILVPDLQVVAQYVASDKLHEPLYQSGAGPITPHDMIYGHGPSIASGRDSMAHRSGFTPGLLAQLLKKAPFGDAVIRRRPAALELAIIARKTAPANAAERDALITALGL